MDLKWIHKILAGEKSWEIRGDNTKTRDVIGLLACSIYDTFLVVYLLYSSVSEGELTIL